MQFFVHFKIFYLLNIGIIVDLEDRRQSKPATLFCEKFNGDKETRITLSRATAACSDSRKKIIILFWQFLIFFPFVSPTGFSSCPPTRPLKLSQASDANVSQLLAGIEGGSSAVTNIDRSQ